MTKTTLLITFALSILVAPFAAAAPQAGKVYRVAILTNNASDPLEARLWQAFRLALRELGWIEGWKRSADTPPPAWTRPSAEIAAPGGDQAGSSRSGMSDMCPRQACPNVGKDAHAGQTCLAGPRPSLAPLPCRVESTYASSHPSRRRSRARNWRTAL
jgi:hypothetical protein